MVHLLVFGSFKHQMCLINNFGKHARFIKLSSQGSESIISTSKGNVPIVISNVRKNIQQKINSVLKVEAVNISP